MPKKKRVRNYRKEYDTYHGTEEQRANRVKRVQARREAEKDGRVKKGDGKEVGHLKPLSKGGGNEKGNTRVMSRTANRKAHDKDMSKPTKKTVKKKACARKKK